MNFIKSIKTKLNKTGERFSNAFSDIFSSSKNETELLERLEELLIVSDFGVKQSEKIINYLKDKRLKNLTEQQVKQILLEEVSKEVSLKLKGKTATVEHKANPTVILLFGVNGSGKTTTISKLSHLLTSENKKVILAACDTFRAGATDQLITWANKLKVKIVFDKEGSDPASIAYKAYKQAVDENYDYLIIDTSGRLQNNQNLMQELAKINNVLAKLDASLPHYKLLVLDGTNGQNMLSQIEQFNKLIPLSGLIVTKLDGTAKAGAVISAIEKFSLPIFYLTFGEAKEDLKEFDLKEFLQGVLDI
ncbi:MAG: signal recognition particle-docking protein FtsY [Alphaproteobacteria bacterium]|jgi:fused signal recognition particle receptor